MRKFREFFIDSISNERLDNEADTIISGDNKDIFYDEGYSGGVTTEMLEYATASPTSSTVETTTIPTSEFFFNLVKISIISCCQLALNNTCRVTFSLSFTSP